MIENKTYNTTSETEKENQPKNKRSRSRKCAITEECVGVNSER